MPMGTGEKSHEKDDSSNVERNFHESVKYTEKKEGEHATCGSYGRGRKAEMGKSHGQHGSKKGY